MLTFAVLVPSVAPPEACESVTVKDLLPVNGVALLTGTEKVLAAASPAVQFKVPEVAVYSFPLTAEPLLVAYVTLTAPLVPLLRFTVTFTALAVCATE
jgi:hypothetical protein